MSGVAHSLAAIEKRLSGVEFSVPIGRIIEANPGRIISTLGSSFVGEICEITNSEAQCIVKAQTIAIKDGKAILAPLGDINGLPCDAKIIPTGSPFKIFVGDSLLGRVVDGLGQPIDGRELKNVSMTARTIIPNSISPMERPIIDTPLQTGIRSIDSLITLGVGQRVGILGDSGTGKSTILSMLARQAKADVCVFVSIGERGREVRELLERQLPIEVRKNCVIIVSTAEKPAMERLMASHLGLAVAEYFRDQSKHVLLLFDSVTRFARAQREVALAAGEVAVRRGYTASLYAELPRLIERCGKTEKGAISAIFSVLTESEGIGDPIAEELISLTDGHIILSSKLGQSGHFPAIDILASRSRLMSELVDEEHLRAANKMRSLMDKYNEVELLVQVGEYHKGADSASDEAIQKHPQIINFLRQQPNEKCCFTDSVKKLMSIVANG